VLSLRCSFLVAVVVCAVGCSEHSELSATPPERYVPDAHAATPSRIGVISANGSTSLHDTICGDATSQSSAVVSAVTRVRETTGLSDEFLDACAGCHGLDGRGKGNYPDLTAAAEAMEAVVRGGRGAMPAFSERAYSQAALASDSTALALLRERAAVELPDLRDAPRRPPQPLDEAAYLEHVRNGLRAWREPGEHGACAACHSPDGIDLARVGYTHATILRRAVEQGRAPADAVLIADMIEAHRRFHRITEPCSPTFFRPLQPAGERGAGSDGSAELELLQTLERAGVELNVPPADAGAARAIADVIAKLDVRSVPLALRLSRLTSDAFHSQSDRTTSEWIPEIALEPRNAEAERSWIDATNRYLEHPDAGGFWTLYEAVEHLSSERFVTDGVAQRLSREKFRATLLMQHLLRSGRNELPELGSVRLAGKFPIWESAQVAVVMTRGCAEIDEDGPLLPCWNYPPEFYAKMAMDRAELIADLRSFIASWFVAGWLVDPSLQFTEEGAARIADLHLALDGAAAFSIAPEGAGHLLPAHHLYFGLVRLVKAIDAMDPKLPAGRDFERQVVNGCWSTPSIALEEWVAQTLPALDRLGIGRVRPDQALPREVVSAVESFAFGAVRMVLYLVEAALDDPPADCKAAIPDSEVDLRTLVERMADFGDPAHPSVEENRALARRIASRL
jgi:mono/diheme cytochrome c family protein